MAKSVMAHQFSKAPQANIQRSKFNRNHGRKTTFDSGVLVPILCDEVYPGDSVRCRMDALVRMATPIHVPMDNIWIDTHFFFVPNRLIWTNWQRFMGEQDNPDDSTDYLVPVLSNLGTANTEGSNFDHMELPPGIDAADVSALPFRALHLIWNQWYRDQNLQDSLQVKLDDGPDDANLYKNLLKRGKRHDYFTSALPAPQRGPGVDIPLNGNALVQADAAGVDTQVRIGAGALIGTTRKLEVSNPGGIETIKVSQIAGTGNSLYADLSSVSATTINELRSAFQIQKMMERDARGGTRYIELIKSHFQVTSPDARLQRAEYLGGGTSGVHMHVVPQTSGTPSGTGQYTPTEKGNLSAYGTATMQGHGFSKGFVEHGWIIGLMSVRADLTYQQGIPRQLLRQTKHDFYWPALQGLGEQAVQNREIWADGTAADLETFGYQERFAEMRYKNSCITGAFRSDSAASLDAWHLSQDFETRPALNDLFITENPPIDRIVAVPDEPQFIMDSYFNYSWARPLPMYGVPGYIDHF